MPMHNLFIIDPSQVSTNQRELVGILRAISALAVVGKRSCDKVAVALAKFLSRNDITKSFPSEVNSALPIFDPIMVRHWAELKKSGVTLTTYMDCNKDLMALLLDEGDWEPVRQCGGDYNSVKGPLSRLVGTSGYGRALFGFTEAAMGAQDFSATVDSALSNLLPQISDPAQVEEFKAKMEEESAAYAAMKLPMSRKIQAIRS